MTSLTAAAAAAAAIWPSVQLAVQCRQRTTRDPATL